MKILLTSLLVLFILLPSCALEGGELEHKWKSPSFSGIGTSAHFLTIENQEFIRKAEIKSKREAAEAKELAAAKNTNYAKFVDNLESRIYAEFSKWMSESLFGEPCGQTYTTADGTTTADTMNPQDGNEDGVGTTCGSTYTFNDTTITYEKDIANDKITLLINGPDGNTEIILPLNDFRF
jgi:hypothetical protein